MFIFKWKVDWPLTAVDSIFNCLSNPVTLLNNALTSSKIVFMRSFGACSSFAQCLRILCLACTCKLFGEKQNQKRSELSLALSQDFIIRKKPLRGLSSMKSLTFNYVFIPTNYKQKKKIILNLQTIQFLRLVTIPQ